MFVLDMSKELRGSRLVNDYCNEEDIKSNNSWIEGLKQCISLKKGGLAKRLGGERVKKAIAMLDNGNYHKVAIMMLDYYDKLYKRWVEETQSKSVKYITCQNLNEKTNADLLMNSYMLNDDNNDTDKNNNKDMHNISDQNMIATNDQVPTFSGTCHCGQVEVMVFGVPHSVSYCHCSICRKLSGAPFSCQALFKPNQVKVKLAAGGNISPLATSRAVDRYRCVTCLSPIKASVLGGKVIAVPLQLITSWIVGKSNLSIENEAYRPRHHLYYNDRVMDIHDELPKYSHGARTNMQQQRKRKKM